MLRSEYLLKCLCLTRTRIFYFFILTRGYILLNRERELLLKCASTRDRIQNLGMCPGPESNPQPFGIWDNAPSASATLARATTSSFEPHEQSYNFLLLCHNTFLHPFIFPPQFPPDRKFSKGKSHFYLYLDLQHPVHSQAYAPFPLKNIC